MVGFQRLRHFVGFFNVPVQAPTRGNLFSVCLNILWVKVFCHMTESDLFHFPICLVSWLVVLRIYVDLAVFHQYRDLEAGDNQSLKFKWRDRESNPGPLAPKANSLTPQPLPLPPICLIILIQYFYLVLFCCSNSERA